MEISVKVIVLCVIFTYVVAEVEDHKHLKGPLKPQTIQAYRENKANKLKKRVVECAEANRVNPEKVLKLMSTQWRWLSKKVSAPLKNWSLCLLNKYGMMSPGGILKQDVVLANVARQDIEKVEEAIDKCLYKKRYSPAETAWHYVMCFRNRVPKYSII